MIDKEPLAWGAFTDVAWALETLCVGFVDFELGEDSAALDAAGFTGAAVAAVAALAWEAGEATGADEAVGVTAGGVTAAGVALASFVAAGVGVGVAAKDVAQAAKTIRVASNFFILRPFSCLKAPRLGVSIQRSSLAFC